MGPKQLATTLGQRRPGSNGNEGLLYIPESIRAGVATLNAAPDLVLC